MFEHDMRRMEQEQGNAGCIKRMSQVDVLRTFLRLITAICKPATEAG